MKDRITGTVIKHKRSQGISIYALTIARSIIIDGNILKNIDNNSSRSLNPKKCSYVNATCVVAGSSILFVIKPN